MLTCDLLFPRNVLLAKHSYSAQIQKEVDCLPPALPVTRDAHHAVCWTLQVKVFYLGNLHLILQSSPQPKWMSGKKNKPKLSVSNFIWYTYFNNKHWLWFDYYIFVPNMTYTRLILISTFPPNFRAGLNFIILILFWFFILIPVDQSRASSCNQLT